ncbi:MAG: tRNA pseudouridine(13) synthase TruD [Methanomicrobiaceae archaeon]|nr:tRNA pseudouridine(13) synthase TruD [Methanomicrobiaceae archaeon]
MIKSEYPIEILLGMDYYSTGSRGTGGILKKSPEDFRVNELYGDIKMSGGPYLICELEKTNWDLQRAVREISKVLGVSHRRISWAGTKDKRAVTKQLISIYGINEEQIANIRIKDISLKTVGRANSQISLGELKGNSFGITISDIGTEDPSPVLEEVTSFATAGNIPNYFGIQRFGATRPVTHLTGFEILKGDFREAVKTYISFSCGHEPEDTETARKHYRDCEDAKETLAIMPTHLRYELAMLHHLVEKPGDYEGALKVTPPKLLSMFVSAAQSWVFNKALSRRLEIGGLDEPFVGDRIIFEGGREDVVTEENIRTARVHMKRGRCVPAIFMPGSEDFKPAGETDIYIAELLEEAGIGIESFRRASEVTETAFRGASRAAAIRADLGWKVSGDKIDLEFSLSPGTYATTICREIMKTDPEKMI